MKAAITLAGLVLASATGLALHAPPPRDAPAIYTVRLDTTNGRTTQAFINLQDNSATHDKEPFVVFGRVIEGMNAADALNAEYGESSGGGIRAGQQDPLFAEGEAYLARAFPRLDVIDKASV